MIDYSTNHRINHIIRIPKNLRVSKNPRIECAVPRMSEVSLLSTIEQIANSRNYCTKYSDSFCLLGRTSSPWGSLLSSISIKFWIERRKSCQIFSILVRQFFEKLCVIFHKKSLKIYQLYFSTKVIDILNNNWFLITL